MVGPGPCTSCGQQCREVADDGRRYCDVCWTAWDLGIDLHSSKWTTAEDKAASGAAAKAGLASALGVLGAAGACTSCGQQAREAADDGSAYCDGCWQSRKTKGSQGSPGLLGKSGNVWQVIGGSVEDGISVRAGKDESSPEVPGLLLTGGLVRVLERDAGRARYELLVGAGPAGGWVSAEELREKPGWVSTRELWETCDGVPAQGGGALNQKVEPMSRQQVDDQTVQDAAGCENGAADALRLYGKRLSERDRGQNPHFHQELVQDLWSEPCSWAPAACPARAGGRGQGKKGSGKGKPVLPTSALTASLLRAPGPPEVMRHLINPMLLDLKDLASKALPGRPLQHSGAVCEDGGDGAESRHCIAAGPPETGRAARAELEHNLWAEELEARREAALQRRATGESFCCRCCLPVGDYAYEGDRPGTLLHGECMAQNMLRDLREEDEARREKDAALKKARRDEFDIGWRADRVPSNVGPAERLECRPVPQGMCGLAMDAASNSVRVVPTLEPAASTNLDYLSVALRVRRSGHREPLFSLDPVAAGGPSGDGQGPWQVKRFEPEWLAGTSVGEILFQSDYHLKELSMGEYEQPVVGMKSCLDLSDAEGRDAEWSAREWFVVRKAEVHMTDDDVLIPYLKMGVEAREQVAGAGGLEDARITRPDHPLVKYADQFTKNFDLIAERKSVIYHLRELAKAAVLAKFLLESDTALEASWFELAGEAKGACCMEVPQLWNDRRAAKIQLEDGKIVDAEKGQVASTHSLYGGVQFGLDRFQLLRGPRPGAVSSVAASLSMAAALRGAPVRAAVPGMPAALSAVKGLTTSVTAGLGPGAARGVDLDLGGFDLSSARRVAAQASAGGWAAVGGAFWSSIDGGPAPVFEDGDRHLLKAIFNPHLSDRRAEGDSFAPPDNCASYVDKLRSLVKEEALVRRQRKEHFFGAGFVPDDPGRLFPSSWAAPYEIARAQRGIGRALGGQHGGKLHARPDLQSEARALDGALRSAAPVFDRSAEDGGRFRAYRFGGLEVRTYQEHDGEEAVGAVFSTHAPPGAAPAEGGGQRASRAVQEGEKIAKAVEYVERARQPGPGAVAPPGADPRLPQPRFYVVLETLLGSAIVTEQLPDGTVTWQENPRDLEDRTSLSKVLRSAECVGGGATVVDMKAHRMAHCLGGGAASQARCRGYADHAFDRAAGQERRAEPGSREAGTQPLPFAKVFPLMKFPERTKPGPEELRRQEAPFGRALAPRGPLASVPRLSKGVLGQNC